MSCLRDDVKEGQNLELFFLIHLVSIHACLSLSSRWQRRRLVAFSRKLRPDTARLSLIRKPQNFANFTIVCPPPKKSRRAIQFIVEISLHTDRLHWHACFFVFLSPSRRIDYMLIANLMHWLLFIHKILFSSTCFETQVLIFRRIQLYTCSIRYCHSLWEFVVACRYTAWVRTESCVPTDHQELWQYHMLHVRNCILLKMSTWGSKHVEENNIWWINNNQCIKLVINVLPSKVTARSGVQISDVKEINHFYPPP